MAAATKIGDNGSDAMAVALERPCWVAGWRRKGKGSGNGWAAAEVMETTVDGNIESGLDW